MQALPPKHLARRESRLSLATKSEYLFESLTAIALLLVAVTVFVKLPDRSGSEAATAQPAPGQGGEATSAPAGLAGAGSSGNLVANWSFEEDLGGWQVLGEADAGREPQGRTSGSSASVGARGPQPGLVGLRLPGVVGDARKGSRYVASAWVRSTAPAQRVSIRLVGGAGAEQTSREEEAALRAPGSGGQGLGVPQGPVEATGVQPHVAGEHPGPEQAEQLRGGPGAELVTRPRERHRAGGPVPLDQFYEGARSEPATWTSGSVGGDSIWTDIAHRLPNLHQPG
jgi:hypothetical protein